MLHAIFNETCSNARGGTVVNNKTLLGCLPLFLLAVQPPALAQADGRAPSASGPAAATDSGWDEIVVTARRRAESTLDVPIAVTAVSGQALERANVTSLADLQRIAPSVRTAPVAGRASSTAFFIRGLAETTGSVAADPSTGVYFADAIMTRPQGVGRALYDLESVQVLNGPQGTLFGRNLTGGAVLITPAPAVIGEIGGYGRVRIGNYKQREVEAAVNVPVGDWIAIRAAGSIVRRDPFVTNIVTGNGRADEHSNSGRLTVNIEPSVDFSNVFVLDYFDGRSRGLDIIPTNLNRTVDTPPNPLAPREAWLLRQQAEGIRGLVDGVDGPFSTASNLGFTNTTRVDLGGVTVKNIFNYRRIRSYDQQATATPPTPTTPTYYLIDITNIMRSRQYSNELQLSGSLLDDLVYYTSGGYFFWERATQNSYTATLGGPPRRNFPRVTNESKSLFAQIDVRAAEKLTFTIGGRYTWDNRELHQNVILPSGQSAVDEVVSKDFGKFTYTLALNYKPTSEALLYLTTRRGYRSGGFNAGATSSAALAPVRPEVLTDYEAGFKFQSSAVRFSLAAFHSKYTDIQRTLLTIVGTPPTATQMLLNAADARVNGAELEAVVRPAGFLELSGFVSYVDAKYKKFINPLDGSDISKTPFSQTPKWTYRIGADLIVPTPESVGEVRISADYNYQGGVLGGESATIEPGYMLDARGLLGARLSIERIAATPVSFALYARNLTNKGYYTAISPLYGAPFGITRSVVGDPRTWGAELSFKF